MTTKPRLPTKKINAITSHTGPINAIAFSNLGGTYILTGSSDRSIHLSRTELTSSTSTSTSTSFQTSPPIPTTTQPIQKYTSHGYPILSLSISTQNTHFASSSSGDRSIFYWDIQTPNSTVRRFGSNTTQQHTSRITCISFAAESDSVIVSGSHDRSVRLWDVKSRDTRPLMVIEDAKDGISALDIKGAEIIVGSLDSRIRSYDLRMGRCVVDVMPGVVGGLEVSRDGKCLLVGCLDGKIRLFERASGGLLRAFPDLSPNTNTNINTGGGGGGGVAGIGETETGYKNDSLRLQSCFGANEALVVSGSEADGKVRAWDVLTGKMVDEVLVSEVGKVVSVVKWREGSIGQARKDVWAAGGADGVVRIYGG